MRARTISNASRYTYTSTADRARAWRERQKALIAQVQQPAEPVTIEKVVENIRHTFDDTLDLETMQAYASRETCAAETQRRGVDREFELRAAIKIADSQRLAHEIAEISLETGKHGRRWKDGDATCYSAGRT